MTVTLSTPLGRIESMPSVGVHFARLLARLAPGTVEEVLVAGALACRSLVQGDVCLDLSAIAGRDVSPSSGSAASRAPELAHWESALRASPLVGPPGEFRPLILDTHHRLYLYRCWQWEDSLARNLLARARQRFACPPVERVRPMLRALFADSTDPGQTDWQAIAALVSLLRGLCVISGGPGSGKTFTIARILVLLQHVAGISPRHMLLAAPTGKAAARLQQTMAQACATLRLPGEMEVALPAEAMTVHRLLGMSAGRRARRTDDHAPLRAELVVVDEASMVDMALLSRLVAAVPPSARLILVGDRDQLASVEAGAALGDICPPGHMPEYASAFAGELGTLAGQPVPSAALEAGDRFADSIVVLQRNRRFAAQSAIAQLSRAVCAGQSEQALDLLHRAADADEDRELCWWPLHEPHRLWPRLAKTVLDSYSHYLAAGEPVEALQRFGRLRVLCAVRGGALGVEEANRRIEAMLREAGLLTAEGRFYEGRPLIVTVNDYRLELFNGEMGLMLSTAGALRAFFPTGAGAARAISPWRLPAHETAFALTVHKCQGSEFETVVVVLPEQDLPLLTRELLYTAITRATRRVVLVASEAVLRGTISRRIERRSGLREALQGDAT
jgi:exodeoxyribonuclease V alpha subunit